LTHLTGFLRLLARHDPRRGLSDHKWVVTLLQRAKKAGLCWAKYVPQRRSGACPMPRIALRAAPSRMNGFVTIKRVIDYFLWYEPSTLYTGKHIKKMWIGALALFALAAVSSPALADESVDPIVTGAIAGSVSTSEERGSIAFREALALLGEEKYADAYAKARRFSNSLERRTIQWAAIYFGKGAVDYNSIIRFAADAPEFASARLYKTRLEQSLSETGAPKSEVIRTLGGQMPRTIDGQIMLAKAYIADGQRARAARIARQIWTTNFLTREQEERALSAFSSLLSRADHWRRAVYLLMSDRARGAERLLSFLSPAQRSLALARIAVSRKASTADTLLDRVDPGPPAVLFFKSPTGAAQRRPFQRLAVFEPGRGCSAQPLEMVVRTAHAGPQISGRRRSAKRLSHRRQL